MSIKEHTVSVNGISIHYAESGTGRLVIFLHGFPEFWYAWRRQLQAFGRTHHAVAVDMRGYNLSSKPESTNQYKAEEVAKDIIALADRFGADKFSIVGQPVFHLQPATLDDYKPPRFSCWTADIARTGPTFTRVLGSSVPSPLPSNRTTP